MNTPEPYERRLDRTLPETPPSSSEPEKAVDALAVQRDPSIPHAAPEQSADVGDG